MKSSGADGRKVRKTELQFLVYVDDGKNERRVPTNYHLFGNISGRSKPDDIGYSTATEPVGRFVQHLQPSTLSRFRTVETWKRDAHAGQGTVGPEFDDELERNPHDRSTTKKTMESTWFHTFGCMLIEYWVEVSSIQQINVVQWWVGSAANAVVPENLLSVGIRLVM